MNLPTFKPQLFQWLVLEIAGVEERYMGYAISEEEMIIEMTFLGIPQVGISFIKTTREILEDEREDAKNA